jgi:signal transduction histidine kinase
MEESQRRERVLGRLAWPLLFAFLTFAVTGMFLQGLNGPVPIEEYGVGVGFTSIGVFGAFMASRRPTNPVGWLFLGAATLAALGLLGSEYATYALVTRSGELGGGVAAGWVGNLTWLPSLGCLVTFLLLLFPNGRLPSRRWRPVAWAAGVTIAVVDLAIALAPGPLDVETGAPVANPFGIEVLDPLTSAVAAAGFPALGLLGILSAASLVVRYRRAGSDERHQLKWFLLAGVLMAVGISTGEYLPDAVTSITFTVALASLPAAAAVAVVKYRLYDIDVVINKAVVFGALAALFTAMYVGIVVGIGTLVGSRGNLFLSVVATALIAVAFHPARERARRFANRLVYGRRATPYEVLSEFAGRVGGAYSSEDVLPRMARIVAEGTGADRAEVWLRVGSELRRAAAWPSSGGDGASSLHLEGEGLPALPSADRAHAVRHRGELLGALAVSKPPSEPLTPAEDRLVEDIASQAGLVLRNVRLIAELRESRQRIVAAQDQERRRIERNIHDGAQQQLVALAVKLRLARQLMSTDGVRAEALMATLEGEASAALEDLRDLARGIYPPLLADQGLVAALRAQARRSPVDVAVEADAVRRYPQEAEAAVYFCALEALQNVAKYSEASRATVRLADGAGELRFEVTDDGHGFDPEAAHQGTGLQGMADRLAAVGGDLEIRSRPGAGTTVSGRLPIEVAPAAP